MTLVLASLQLAEIIACGDHENFAYINKIVDSLNVERECNLPSYKEIDELQNSLDKLERTHGGDKLNELLNDDQKLLRKTLLVQWTSFQKRMTSEKVIRSAKLRSFLCRIEDYQKAKFGHSICMERGVLKNPNLLDHVFEEHSQTVEATLSNELLTSTTEVPFVTMTEATHTTIAEILTTESQVSTLQPEAPSTTEQSSNHYSPSNMEFVDPRRVYFSGPQPDGSTGYFQHGQMRIMMY